MKKLHFAVKFLKHLPHPSLHSFMLTKAVEIIDSKSVQCLLQSNMVDRFSDLDQSLVLLLALDNLCNFWSDDIKEPQSRNTARIICHMILDRGISFRGKYETNIRAYVPFLIACNEMEITLKLFHEYMSDNIKIDTFADLVRRTPEEKQLFVTQLYNLWGDVLTGPIEVSRLGWMRLHSDTRTGPPTLMEWCLASAPDPIVLNLINDCTHIGAEECRNLLVRSSVRFDILDALVDKGVDLQRLLDITERPEDEIIMQIQAYQQRKTIEQTVSLTAVSSTRRKM